MTINFMSNLSPRRLACLLWLLGDFYDFETSLPKTYKSHALHFIFYLADTLHFEEYRRPTYGEQWVRLPGDRTIAGLHLTALLHDAQKDDPFFPCYGLRTEPRSRILASREPDPIKAEAIRQWATEHVSASDMNAVVRAVEMLKASDDPAALIRATSLYTQNSSNMMTPVLYATDETDPDHDVRHLLLFGAFRPLGYLPCPRRQSTSSRQLAPAGRSPTYRTF